MSKPNIERRLFLRRAGAVTVSLPFLGLLSTSGKAFSASPTLSADVMSKTGWASGGTAGITVPFPDTSIFETGTQCNLSLTKSKTLGPCYFEVSERVDISEGEPGLPMQLCLRVIDSNCEPLSNVELEVWHCDVEGLYSGNTENSEDSRRFREDFCTSNDQNAEQKKWFRGTQVTDEDGRVNFATCLPGWYSGRVIHIHFRVRNNRGKELISQFTFEDQFSEMIYTSHKDYAPRGVQDTPLSRDRIFGRNYEEYLFNLKKNSDGSLLAYKTIVIDS